MKSTIAIAIAALTALGFASSAGATTAGLYSGRFPVTVTETGGHDFTGCLALTDDGTRGFPHSGPAVLDTHQSGGEFQIIGRFLLVTIEEPGGTGQNAGLVFVVPARSGILGVGVFDEVFGGTDFVRGKATFGNRGGC